MPNWTSNTVTFNANKKDYQRVIDRLTKENTDTKVNEARMLKLVKIRNIKNPIFGFEQLLFDTKMGWHTNKIYFPGKFIDLDLCPKLTKLTENLSWNEPQYYLDTDELFGTYINWTLQKIKKPKEKHIDFNNVIPVPPETIYSKLFNYGSDQSSPYHWYNWQTEHWGTKWNACDSVWSYDDDDQEGKIRFDTAWCEPTPVLEALSKMFPDITFTNEAEDEDGSVVITEFTNGSSEELDSNSNDIDDEEDY